MKNQTEGVKSLGAGKTDYKYNEPSTKILETFPNQYLNRNYKIHFGFPEFTSLCPKTGQPDFAHIDIYYVADKRCIESKSLKLYFFAFRNYGSFMETIVNKILEDLVSACKPTRMTVVGKFNARGGTTINVTASYESWEEAV